MKKIKFILLSLMTIFAMSGCVIQKGYVSEVKQGVRYFQDERVGLCFASVYSDSYGSYTLNSIACVPCDSVSNKLTAHYDYPLGNIQYFKDDAVGVCYATAYSYSYGSYVMTSITVVPCDSVENMLTVKK